MYESPEFIARQLRKPSGDFAGTIAEKMGEGNRSLYDLMLGSMLIKDHDSILEIGFGSGTHFSDLLARAKNINVTGIDYSPDMTNMAKTNNKDEQRAGRLKLHTGNSNRLPFEDNSFHTVFCNMVIYFWDDPAEHLGEIQRVLKPGGLFYTGMRTRDSMLQFPFTKFGFNLYSIDQWKSVLQSHGFFIVRELRQKDPVFDDGENRVELESVSIAAKKQG
ncbi:MAG: class I SAM-dependent methyltransferase [Balneolaceae bacterium]|nr:class I SAM-dependent methyltransferase [Balneolaceae bacterium]MCH8549674.1 class I SAM-dependent methyltransferase [Balneolaceae bacterium]